MLTQENTISDESLCILTRIKSNTVIIPLSVVNVTLYLFMDLMTTNLDTRPELSIYNY